MGNTLFKVIDGDILQKEGSSPSLRYTGYGFNQVAFQVMAHGYKDAADLLAKIKSTKERIIMTGCCILYSSVIAKQ